MCGPLLIYILTAYTEKEEKRDLDTFGKIQKKKEKLFHFKQFLLPLKY